VELPNTVEGMIRMNNLDDDYYIFDEQRYELQGESTKKIYKLGQTIRIQVLSTDRMLKTIDFIPVKDEE
jgi:ribonuclease R